jgi:hypothetical protein
MLSHPVDVDHNDNVHHNRTVWNLVTLTGSMIAQVEDNKCSYFISVVAFADFGR